MARKTTTRRTTTKKKKSLIYIRPELIGTILLIMGGITLLSLFTSNRSLPIIAWLGTLRFMIGWGVYIFWLVLGILAFWFFTRYSTENSDEKWEKPVGTFLLLGILLIIFDFIEPGNDFTKPGGGGVIGWFMAVMLTGSLGKPNTVVLLFGLTPLVIILISGLSLRQFYGMIQDLYHRFQDWRHFRQLNINQASVYDQSPKSKFIDRILPSKEQDDIPPILGAIENKALPTNKADKTVQVNNNHRWKTPTLAQIFDEGAEREISENEIRQRVKIIEDTLASFSVEAKVREINQGPAVTQFSLEPLVTKDAKGNPRKVRVSKIVNLSNDLALALAAAPIRIEAPIPGRPYIGLEVPNSTTNMVTLRSLMESNRFFQLKGKLKLALGQDVSGRPIIADLSTMPHLLIAGATGSGKSVCVNSIVSCLISIHTPLTLRLLMVDPKMVELINYNDIPHLLAPVVTELEKVVGVLNWATREMDRRYKLFSKEGVRNLISYNNKIEKAGGEAMPYIVIIIDELADLMMMAPDEIERMITRLAQMARATGMHLILATQRPSVDVVTGLIKANFPARIAFAVSSQIDSRVILDTPGAERLLGKGDMLYMSPDSVKLRRLQGVFVSDKELNRLTKFWKGSSHTQRREPRPSVQIDKNLKQQSMWEQYKDIEKEAGTNQQDELFDKAVSTVRKQGKASVSILQRRLRIGYARAARLIDEMEAQGIISADEGKILVTQADDEADPTADDEI